MIENPEIKEDIEVLSNFASEKEVNDAMSCSEKDPDEANAENPAKNEAFERFSDFASEKEVNDAMSCSEKDPDESVAENPAKNEAIERLSGFASEKVVNDGESCSESTRQIQTRPSAFVFDKKMKITTLSQMESMQPWESCTCLWKGN